MRARTIWIHISLLLLASVESAPAAGQSEGTVVVLGIQSVEGDDEFARNLTRELRQRTAATDRWLVSDREVSLSQMILAYGCEGPTPSCLAEIADALEADGLIYGIVQRSNESRFSVELHFFDVGRGSIENSVTDQLERADAEGAALEARTASYVAQLLGAHPAVALGSLEIRSDTPGASVSIDGEPMGVTDEDGELLVNELPVGPHEVSVRSERHDFATQITIEANQTTEIPVTLQSVDDSTDDRREIVRWPSYALFGAGALFTGLTIYSWVRINNLDSDPDFIIYRQNIATGLDACEEASRGNNHGLAIEILENARSVCNQADRLQALQWIFLTSALASFGVGTWWWFRSRRRDNSDDDFDEGSDAEFTLIPHVEPGGAHLSAWLQF